MTAHLYICDQSFHWNGIDLLPQFQEKMVKFQRMMECINNYADENILFLVVDSFLNTQVLENVIMSDILNDYEKAVNLIGKDALVILLNIIKHCRSITTKISDLKDYLLVEDENLCHAVIVFSPIGWLENHIQVISTKHGWYCFRRYYLGKYPKDTRFFLEESKKYYPGLNIHHDNEVTMRNVIHSHSMQIVNYLAVLNDHFARGFLSCGKNLKDYLPLFARTYKLDDASLEGNKDDKFYFDFYENGKTTTVYCEAHLKMYHDDKGNDNKHCRIYFKKPVAGESYIYVGHIGEHL